MLFVEFTSMVTLYTVMPDLVPKIIGWRAYANETDTYFFLCAFREMNGEDSGEISMLKHQAPAPNITDVDVSRKHSDEITAGKYEVRGEDYEATQVRRVTIRQIWLSGPDIPGKSSARHDGMRHLRGELYTRYTADFRAQRDSARS
jgi:hypothetical protein